MKANELRIGNFIKFSEDGTIFTVDSIEEKGLVVQNEQETAWIELEEFEPIHLNEEWLLKFGFIKSSDNNYYKDGKFTIYNRFKNFGLIGGLLSWKEFKYAHQLQNLYFALTGEELINVQK
jgi:hypothetical protein